MLNLYVQVSIFWLAIYDASSYSILHDMFCFPPKIADIQGEPSYYDT